MKKILFGIVYLLITAASAQNATYKTFYEEGITHLDENNYQAALSSFLSAYKIDSSNANINFQVGYCYLRHPSHKHLAEFYLEKAIKNTTKNYNGINASETYAPLQAFLWLGEAYHLDYKFDKAEQMMKMYEEQSHIDNKDKEEYAEVERLRKIIATAKKKVASPAKILIENMGDSINSEFPDFSPVLSADERVMIFTYRGEKSTGGNRTIDGQYFEDIFISYKKYDGSWTEAKSIGSFVNTIGHEASVSVTPDGQTLILYKDDEGDGNLYFSNWSGSQWGIPEKLGDEINTKYWETHACFNVTKDILYFVSDRPGGYGGRDIYRSKKLPNGHWGKPVNLGPKINTAYDEDAPFLHSNGSDFYFASQAHKTMGGFDIFKSEIILGTDSFTTPEALPYPINTTDDDVFFVLSPDKRRAYYASSHEDPTGRGEKDIYRIYMPEAQEPPLVVFIGQVLPAPCDELPENLTIEVTEKGSEELVGMYRPHPATGSFTMILFPGKTYMFNYKLDDKILFSEPVSASEKQAYQEINREVTLPPIELGATKNQQLPCVLAKLDVRVYTNKTNMKAVQNAEVVLTDKIGRKTKVYTNEKGEVKNIAIRADDEFTLVASSKEKKSVPQKFATKNFKADTLISKIIFLEDNGTDGLTGPKIALPESFHYNFAYNKNEINAKDAEYKNFISKLKNYIAVTGGASIKITSSASTVPTKTFGSNKTLAESRAVATFQKIKATLQAQEIDTSKLKFEPFTSEVNGPAYNNDAKENRKEYEKYQYVNVSVVR